MKLTIVSVLLSIILLSSFKTGDVCPVCGSSSCIYLRNEVREQSLRDAVTRGLDSKVSNCNELVEKIASEYGYSEFTKKDGTPVKADEMFETFFSTEGIKNHGKNCIISSTDPASGKVQALGIKDVQALSQSGNLAIGFVDSKVLNYVIDHKRPTRKVNGKEVPVTEHVEHGHAFVVTGSTTTSDGTDNVWKTTLVANAGNEKQAALISANRAIPEWMRPYVCFMVITKP
jgi:hypothetical protein